MKLKICGIRDNAMAQKCQSLGIDFIGLNFVPTSKRFIGGNIDPLLCNTIAKNEKAIPVGVFMNQSIHEILGILEKIPLPIIQLHGNESDAFVTTLKNKKTQLKIWKAFLVDENFEINKLQRYCKNCDLLLFDGKSPGSGIPISALERLNKICQKTEQLKIPYGIAGGINAENVGEFKKKFPKATLLDVASGVEQNGQFDAEILERLVQNFQQI